MIDHQFQSSPPLSSVFRFFFAGTGVAADADDVDAALCSFARLIDSEMRRDFSSTSMIRTFTSSPLFTTSFGDLMRWSAISEMCTSPSRPGSSSTNAPKSTMRVTVAGRGHIRRVTLREILPRIRAGLLEAEAHALRACGSREITTSRSVSPTFTISLGMLMRV